ncbi:cobalt chelatase [Brevibacterium luteolum]|uniref:cobaltochelatase CobT-related protein n=1 Tax=Brevibacterium luteolum TaxID=199591 RepID=UPI00387A49F4
MSTQPTTAAGAGAPLTADPTTATGGPPPGAQESPRATRRREHFRELADAQARAATGRPGLHHRGGRLYDGPKRLAVPALHLDPAPEASLASLRGIADAVWLRWEASDKALHRSLRPAEPAARTVFDLLEQLRVESLVPDSAPGARRNLALRFTEWSDEFLASGLIDTKVGLIIFALAHTARSRILAVAIPAHLEDLLEHTRFELAEKIGAPLRQLRRTRHDQEAFAGPARELADIVAALAEEAAAEDELARGGRSGRAPELALFDEEREAEDDDDDGAVAGLGQSQTLSAAAGQYAVFTRAYDETTTALKLVRPVRLRELRRRLDEAISERGLSVHRLTHRLEREFARPGTDGFDAGQPEGRLDRRRLAQLIAAPSQTLVFETERIVPRTELALTVLIDCSGSMRTHQFAIASAVDTFARAGDALGMSVEVLGFTTRSWTGGRAKKDWQRAGSPLGAGRIAERRHIVLLDADAGYRRGRAGLAALLRSDLYKEGLDGEALDWAAARLARREAERRVVLVISDGSPSDAVTANANDEEYLGAHLRRTVDQWTATGRVEIAGLGVGLDLSVFYDRHQTVDIDAGDANAVITGMVELLSRR